MQNGLNGPADARKPDGRTTTSWSRAPHRSGREKPAASPAARFFLSYG